MAPAPDEFLDLSDELLDDVQRQWLQPLGPVAKARHRLLRAATALGMRTTAWSVVTMVS